MYKELEQIAQDYIDNYFNEFFEFRRKDCKQAFIDGAEFSNTKIEQLITKYEGLNSNLNNNLSDAGGMGEWDEILNDLKKLVK